MSEQQANNPLHGITLQHMLEQLVEQLGWEQMATEVRINCFSSNPSIKSSLKFLRKTPWAREQVEQLFVRKVLKHKVRKTTKVTRAPAQVESSEFVWPEPKKS